jgi:hypothetical protein
MITTIPFGGFYESIHSYEVDRAEEDAFQNENGDPNAGLSSRLYWLINYRQLYTSYAEAYASEFAIKTGIKLKFESMSSPREYNFATDRIFCTISREEVRRLKREVDPEALAALAKRKFTSRDGFASFYSPDIESWGSVDGWDHNQLGTLIEASMEDDPEEDIAYEMNSNGDIDNWIDESVPVEKRPERDRLYRIHNYLRHREERDKVWYWQRQGQTTLPLA